MRRTTFGNPHYFNDVMESYFRFVGETNYENLSNRGGEKFPKRIVAPSGSDDPFYYKIETHYGASDHEVFNDWGVQVPGIMMITWPDFYMHSSADRPDKCDPTQLKRAIVIAAATAYTIANSDDEMTIKITDELFSNSLRRTAYQLARGIDELNKANSDNLSELYKKAKGFLGATRINEKETFNTLFELNGSDNTNNHINSMTELYLNAFEIHLKALENHMKLKATSLGVEAVSLEFTDMEKKAYSIVPKPSSKVKEEGYYGWRRVLRDLPKETTDKYPTGEISNTSELVKLIDGNHNVLQIKKMLDTQYEKESDLESILNFVKLLEVAGLVTLN